MIKRHNINEQLSYAEMVEAGDMVFITFCTGNVGQNIISQVNGALDTMESRLSSIGLTLNNVVKVDVMLRDVWNIPLMEQVFKQRFKGHYPARKTIATEFAHRGGIEGLNVQIDAIAYRDR